MSNRNIFNKVLFCTDFSKNADRAFVYALAVAQGNPGCELIVFHVVPEPNAQFWKSYIYEVDKIDEKAKRDIDDKIRDTYLSRIPEDTAWTTLYAVGKTSQKIVEAAREQNADLIIIGRQGNSRFRTLFFGNTTEQLARRSRIPLLVVPNPASS